MMKKSKLIFLFCFLLIIHFAKAQEKNDVYEFPVRPGMQEWKDFKTSNEMSTALMIPDEILKKMSTEGLVETCLNYPLFGSMLAYSNLQTGFEIVSKHFNGLQELLNRKDAGNVLLNKYKKLNPEMLGFYRFDYDKEVYVFTYIELILAQEQIISLLSDKERIELLKVSISKLEEKQNYPEKYSLFVQKTSYLIMARLLKHEGVNIIEDNSRLEEIEELNQFIEYCILPNLNILNLIKEKAISFLSN